MENVSFFLSKSKSPIKLCSRYHMADFFPQYFSISFIHATQSCAMIQIWWPLNEAVHWIYRFWSFYSLENYKRLKKTYFWNAAFSTEIVADLIRIVLHVTHTLVQLAFTLPRWAYRVACFVFFLFSVDFLFDCNCFGLRKRYSLRCSVVVVFVAVIILSKF